MAVDGLLAGVAAGVLMMVVLVMIAWLGGDAPAVTLSRFDPNRAAGATNATPLVGLLAHLATAGVYGALFGMVRRGLRGLQVRPPVWLAGLVYGLVLWLAAHWVLLPATSSPLLEVPPGLFLAAHLTYGLTLGALSGRSR
jgi:hypothetical protein